MKILIVSVFFAVFSTPNGGFTAPATFIFRTDDGPQLRLRTRGRTALVMLALVV